MYWGRLPDLNSQSWSVRTRMSYRGCPLDGSCQVIMRIILPWIIMSNMLGVYHRTLYAKHLLCGLETKRVGALQPLQRLKVLSYSNSPYISVTIKLRYPGYHSLFSVALIFCWICSLPKKALNNRDWKLGNLQPSFNKMKNNIDAHNTNS